MPDTFRITVLKKLTELFQTITPTNGYANDLSVDSNTVRARVQRGRIQYGADDPLPMVSILEPPIPIDGLPQQVDNGTQNGPWLLLLQGWVEDDPEAPTDPAYALLSDVKQCLAKHIKQAPPRGARSPDLLGLALDPSGQGARRGNSVNKITIGRGAVRPADEVSDKAFFWLYLTIELTEDYTDPYR